MAMAVVHDDLKNRIRSSLIDKRELAAICGISYSRLSAMLNGFTVLRPEIERKIQKEIDKRTKKGESK